MRYDQELFSDAHVTRSYATSRAWMANLFNDRSYRHYDDEELVEKFLSRHAEGPTPLGTISYRRKPVEVLADSPSSAVVCLIYVNGAAWKITDEQGQVTWRLSLSDEVAQRNSYPQEGYIRS